MNRTPPKAGAAASSTSALARATARIAGVFPGECCLGIEVLQAGRELTHRRDDLPLQRRGGGRELLLSSGRELEYASSGLPSCSSCRSRWERSNARQRSPPLPNAGLRGRRASMRVAAPDARGRCLAQHRASRRHALAALKRADPGTPELRCSPSGERSPRYTRARLHRPGLRQSSGSLNCAGHRGPGSDSMAPISRRSTSFSSSLPTGRRDGKRNSHRRHAGDGHVCALADDRRWLARTRPAGGSRASAG